VSGDRNLGRDIREGREKNSLTKTFGALAGSALLTLNLDLSWIKKRTTPSAEAAATPGRHFDFGFGIWGLDCEEKKTTKHTNSHEATPAPSMSRVPRKETTPSAEAAASPPLFVRRGVFLFRVFSGSGFCAGKHATQQIALRYKTEKHPSARDLTLNPQSAIPNPQSN
jgi:hypothetical protein